MRAGALLSAEKMLKKLQRKFILAATLTVTIMLLFVLVLVNVVNCHRAWSRIADTLDFIMENQGVIPSDQKTGKDPGFRVSPEFSFQTRYFSVLFTAEQTVAEVNSEHIAALDQEEAAALAEDILGKTKDTGTVEVSDNMYAYERSAAEDGSRTVVVMDISREAENCGTFLQISALFGGLCILIFFIVFTLWSRRAVRPFEENAERQKQFITNAGHELKTPIAVISANTEAMELLNGENEWSRRIMVQVHRLSDLVGELIMLSKSEEQAETACISLDYSGLVRECAEDFRQVALQKGKRFETHIAENISLVGEEKLLREIVNILTDNAVKYCDAGGMISVTLKTSGKRKILEVFNDYKEGKGLDYARMFDRFYRGDASHSSSTEGYGIGLSLAENMTEVLHGKIRAGWQDGRVGFTVVF